MFNILMKLKIIPEITCFLSRFIRWVLSINKEKRH